MDKPIYCASILKNLLKRVEDNKNRLEKNLAQAPEGTVECKAHNGNKSFYRHLKGQPDEYLGKDKEKLIQALIQKKLDKEILKLALNEKKVLEKAIKDLGTKTRDQVWANFPEQFKKYVKVDESLNVGYIKEWKNSWGLIPKDDRHKFLTAKGDYVRSKSEYLIADRLYRSNAIYHYEKPVPIDGGTSYLEPDFTILNPKTLKVFYWEHFGMMDNESYFYKTKQKLEIYSEIGILPCKNLIVTFETSTNPVEIEHIDRLISECLKK